MRKSPKFSPEVIERAVRMAFDAKDQYPSQWAAIESIAAKIGCTAESEQNPQVYGADKVWLSRVAEFSPAVVVQISPPC